MAASGIFSVTSRKRYYSIRSALASAVLEWLLIFLLFINAIFSFLILKFACYCKLETPCVLCSRLDHILGKRKLKNTWGLICHKHKLEVSSLVLCHAHNKLADIYGMCETCLFSFATINRPNAETYRLLVGKVGERSCFRLNEDALQGPGEHAPKVRLCSCCKAPWIPKGHSRVLMQMAKIGSRAAYDKDSLTRTETAGSVGSSHQRINSGSNHLSHVGYKELKVNSDSQSEVPFSDDGDDDANRSHKINPKEDFGIRSVQMEPGVIIHPVDSAFEKLIDPVAGLQPPFSVSQMQVDSMKSNGVILVSPKVARGHVSGEIHWQQADIKYDHSACPELISLDDVRPSSITKESQVEASTESEHNLADDNIMGNVSVEIHWQQADIKYDHSACPELISLDDVRPSSITKESQVEASTESKHNNADDIPPPFDAKQTLMESSKESIHTSMENVPSSSVNASERWARISVNDVLFVDAPDKLIEESTESILTSVAEDHSPSVARGASEWSKLISVDEDLPSLHSKGAHNQTSTSSKLISLVDVLPSSTVVENPVNGIKDSYIPRTEEIWHTAEADAEEAYKTTAASMTETASERIPVLGDNSWQVSNSVDLGDAYEQAVGNRGRQLSGVLAEQWTGMVSEIEGEGLIDWLTRQIEHDKKLLSSLYKELEEERNASSVAVNQAMAMITRLQEEKATVQMEALQCIRMMEEQTEYDMEDLQKTNDILTEREKEIQDLEAELEYYRIKYPDDSFLEGTIEPLSHVKTASIKGNLDAVRDSATEIPGTSHKVEEKNMSSEERKTVTMKDILLDMEDERSYILQSLKKLEYKLFLFPDSQLHLANDKRVNELKELNRKLQFRLNNKAVKNYLSAQNDTANGPAQDHSLSVETSELIGSENDEVFYSGKNSSVIPNLVTLSSEVSDLNERLKALEADKNLLEHSINSLRNGEEGLQFIREIAFYLKELQNIAIRKGGEELQNIAIRRGEEDVI